MTRGAGLKLPRIILQLALVSVPFIVSPSAAAAEARRNPEASAHADGSRDSGRTQRGIGQAARANSDRVRSQLSRQAPRPKNAVAAGPRAANHLQDRTNPSRGTAPAPSNGVAPRTAVAAPQNSAARTGTLGGPHAQGHAMLGGPAIGKAAPAALDGARLLRPKY
jgi:hypothetical protein